MKLEDVDFERTIANLRKQHGLPPENSFLNPAHRLISNIKRTYDDLTLLLQDIYEPYYGCSFGRMPK